MHNTIYFTVSGIGFGHVGRSLRIAESFAEKGFKIVFSTYGEAVHYASANFPCFPLPEIKLGWKSKGGLSLRSTSKLLIKSALPTFVKQVIMEMLIIEKMKPSLIISDSRGSSILAAKIKSKPVLTIANQLAVFLPSQKTGKFFIKLANFLSPVLFPKIWNLSDIIALIDLPPPYTISKRNINARVNPKKIIFVGLIGKEANLSDEFLKSMESLFKDPRKPTIYVSATGPSKERRIFVQKMRNIALRLKRYFNFIFTLGEIKTKPCLVKTSEGIIEYSWFPEREKLIKFAKIVISRAGRATIDQCILNHRPILVIPSSRQTEQEENARRINELGLGKAIFENELNPERIKKALYAIDENYSLHLRKLSLLSNLSRRLGGVNKVTELALRIMK